MAVEERGEGEVVQKTVDVETLLSEIRVDCIPYVGYSDVSKLEVGIVAVYLLNFITCHV